MKNRTLQIILILIITFTGVQQSYAQYQVIPSAKMINGSCSSTELYITINGDAGPFSYKVYLNENLVAEEANLESGIKMFNVSDVGEQEDQLLSTY